jgi:hypothetical protein
LEEHVDGILAYFDFDCLSTGPLEGTNNKIKTMQRKAYGYRDMEFFKLKIMALHETKYALVLLCHITHHPAVCMQSQWMLAFAGA